MATRKNILTVAAAQIKFRATISENVAVIRAFIQKAARKKCDAILFPECAVTGYNIDFSRINRSNLEQAFEKISAAARQNKINVLIGSPTFTGKKLFNSLLVFDRHGREIFRYHKIHLTPRDAKYFHRGNSIALFKIDGIVCTAIICHERRYPELVRLPVMLGAQILFHPNAGLDSLAVSKTKRNGRDGIATRAFENQIHYIFANSVGPQGDNLWSAGDSKIVAPNMQTLALANNSDETLIHTQLDLCASARKYAIESLKHPAFLRPHWKALLTACKRQLREIEKH
ncbi:MAG TPA: carbon-nitrogen hydrolase family protein [Verrucomicrobiae bacterium]|jgi:predicted amidohydrolase